MKKYLVIVFLTSVALTINAQTTTFFDEQSKTNLLIGEIHRPNLLTGDFGVSYAAEYRNYRADSATIAKIREYTTTSDYKWTIKIVLAVWCDDSKVQVPRFFKIADLVGDTFPNIGLVCVDRAKKAGSLDLTPLKIEKVPTFIVYRDGLELGRIVETPSTTLENDLLNLLSIK